MRLLVTGFGPFPRMPRNPSGALARAVAASPRWRRLGIRVEYRVLTTSYAALASELDPALTTGPDAILMIGVAGRADRVRIETRGTARRSTLYPDAAGKVAAGAGETRREPEFRRTRVNAVAALRLLRAAGVPARLSRNAGRYLCNASYFRALAGEAPVLFIHIPVPRPGSRRAAPGRAVHRDSAEARLRDGLVAIGIAMLCNARRVAGR